MRFLVIKRRAIIIAVIAATVFALALTGVYYTGAAAIYNNVSPKKVPIYSVETDEKAVALTFDAAWGADKTLGILETLEEKDACATFFLVGFWAEKYEKELKTLAESERIEIGTHSATHPYMSKLSKSQMSLELSTSKSLIEKISGRKVELFRPPYGDYSDALLNTSQEQGLYTIQWDVDSLDWKNLSKEQIASRVVGNCRNGSIVLMHNDGKHTLEALPAIIDGLRAKGYKFKTVGQLIYKDNYTIDHTGRQIRS
ncbi:polysaccharide deacetylase family protein [Anaerocaecibacter muris]|uniref:polysaccharide deacetylase family protein n=1 Tax=Anaerocaecibacter muris TaxID=2941513 RepID=UPI003F693003